MRRFRPAFLVVAFGADAHVDDPIGGFALPTEYFGEMGAEVRRLGLPSATVHSLRHLSGSLALEGGASLPLVSRYLGHADTSITARVYSHALGDGRAVVQALEAALVPQATDPASADA